MIGGAALWLTYLLLAAVTVVLAMACVLGGAEARARYGNARGRGDPARYVWLALMWVCFALATAIGVAGIYLFLTG